MKIDCLLVLDLGSLGTKAIARKLYGSSNPIAFFVGDGHFSAPDPALFDFGEVNSVDSEIVCRVMSAIWIASRELHLGNNFSVAVNLLLSVSEIRKDVDFLFNLLCAKCKEFESPMGKMSVEIVRDEIVRDEAKNVPLSKGRFPGVGVAFNACISKDLENVAEMVVPVVMLGFRDISISLMALGSMDKEFLQACPLGLLDLVNRIDPGASRYDRLSLVKAVLEIGDGNSILPLSEVVVSDSKEERFIEADSLFQLIKSHREVYSKLVIEWLVDSLPQKWDYIIFSGGDYLKPWLEREFNNTLWHGGVVVPSDLDCGLGNRMADAYGLFLGLYKVIFKPLA